MMDVITYHDIIHVVGSVILSIWLVGLSGMALGLTYFLIKIGWCQRKRHDRYHRAI